LYPVPRHRALLLPTLLVAFAAALPARAADDAGIVIHRAAGAITVDGDLDDPGWRGATRVDTWYETNPGDNVPPKVANVAYLAYDDRYLYAAFEFADPDPKRIRAFYADHDNVPGYTDYGGIILDTRRNGTGYMFLANPRGIQYDAISSDASNNEDSSVDFFWDSAAKITATGWRLEIRIPFSTLRYDLAESPVWGVLLYRNYPRDRRTQMFTSRLPRGGNCFICNSLPLTGLSGLPGGDHFVLAPYVSGSQTSAPRDGAGTPLATGDPAADGGLDAKWIPNPDTVVDATVNPDFSQIESDVAQISTNERFALFFPEKRPFFLEGLDLFATPIQAVYTRTVTSPRWGARATGKVGRTGYTLLVAGDRGGGSVILPGADGSEFVDQDFESTVFIGRMRHDVGRSFSSFLATDREVSGGGHNRVFGPDFNWRPSDRQQLVGQLLWADSETPNRPDLSDRWDGRRLAGHAGKLWYAYSDPTYDAYAQLDDVSDGFRADDGFVPQVGYRHGYVELGRTVHPVDHWVSRLRAFLWSEYSADSGGRQLFRGVTPGAALDGRWNSFWQVRMSFDEVSTVSRTFSRDQLHLIAQVRPSRRISNLYLEASLGDEIDFANERKGTGANVEFDADVRPSDHLTLSLVSTRRWLDVDAGAAGGGRLFTAQVARLTAHYDFTSRLFVRLIGQWVDTLRNPALYFDAVDRESEGLSSSALFAYKLNWQTVFFCGVGDDRELAPDGGLEPAGRQVFVKLSYAFQR
jgi:Domain of unknown function (DUF5916)